MKKMRVLTAVAVAVALTSATVPAVASPADNIAPTTVGVLLQSPAPGSGGVVVGGTYSVSAYVSAGDQTTPAPTDRPVALTFPVGVTVQELYRIVPGSAPVLVPVTGTTVTDTAMQVPVAADASWTANVLVDETTPAGTVLTTTATSAGEAIGSTVVTVVPAGSPECTPTTDPTLCGVVGVGTAPIPEFGPTQTRATVFWSATIPGVEYPAESAVWGSSVVYTGTAASGAPATGEALDAYLAGWIVSQGGGRLAPGGLNVTSGPTLRPGYYTVRTLSWGANYGVTPAGVVYAQSSEILLGRADATIAVVAPRASVKRAPKPVVTTTDTPAAG